MEFHQSNIRKFFLLFFILIISCNKNNEVNNSFNTKDLGLNYEELRNKNYEVVKGNRSVLYQKLKDTTIYLGFDRFNVSRNIQWVIILPEYDLKLVKDFLYKKRISLVESINYLESASGYFFVGIGQLDNFIYVFQLIEGIGDNNHKLIINTTKPFTNKEIDENIEYYDNLDKISFPPHMMVPE